jgi:hypothetical protein
MLFLADLTADPIRAFLAATGGLPAMTRTRERAPHQDSRKCSTASTRRL